MPAPAGVVTVQQLFDYLQSHRHHWPVAKLAKAAGLPRSVVRNAVRGGNPTLRTLTALTKALGCDLVVVVTPGANQLLTL
jgi:DNA-binding phage protein